MLGIVIANWNGEKILDRCLLSLSNQKFKNFKIYIIDNDSKDNSIRVIDEYKKVININLIKMNYNSGFAVANNLGINVAINEGCRYILTLNNDIEVSENCLSRAMEDIKVGSADIYQLFMINYYDRQKCDAAGLQFDKSLIPIQIGYGTSVDEIIKKEKYDLEGVCAGAAIYSVKSLQSVKLENGDYFDSNFFAYYEDVDLSLRLRAKGFKFELLKDSIVYHMHSATGNRTNGFKEYYLTRNMLMYTKRNQSKEALKLNSKYYYMRIAKTLIKNFNNFSAIKSTVSGIKDGLKERKKIKSNFDM